MEFVFPFVMFAVVLTIVAVVGYFSTNRRRSFWRLLEQRMGGQLFISDGLFSSSEDYLDVPIDGFTVRLDFYVVSHGKSSTTYQRVIVQCPAHCLETATIYRETPLFSSIGKAFGGQDIIVNDPDFDEAFIIKSGDSDWLIQALSYEAKQLHLQQRHMRMELDAGSLRITRVGLTFDEASVMAQMHLAAAYAKAFFGSAQPALLEAPGQGLAW